MFHWWQAQVVQHVEQYDRRGDPAYGIEVVELVRAGLPSWSPGPAGTPGTANAGAAGHRVRLPESHLVFRTAFGLSIPIPPRRCFRSWWASWVRVVAARLGHADPSVTLRVYAHVIRDLTPAVADTFGGALPV